MHSSKQPRSRAWRSTAVVGDDRARACVCAMADCVADNCCPAVVTGLSSISTITSTHSHSVRATGAGIYSLLRVLSLEFKGHGIVVGLNIGLFIPGQRDSDRIPNVLRQATVLSMCTRA